MALLKCIECNNDVSEYANACPNCGCPIEVIKNTLVNNIKKDNNICLINKKEIGIDWLLDTLKSLSNDEIEQYKYIYSQSLAGQKEYVKCATKYINSNDFNILHSANELRTKTSKECNLEHKAVTQFLYQLIESNFELKEFNGESYEQWRARQQAAINAIPKCPHCHSTNIAKISGTERAVSVLGMGLLSKKINKSFKCKSCGYTW